MNLLHTLGLMKRSKFEDLESLYHMMAKERNDALVREAEERERFKRAATDLAAQADRIRALNVELAKAGNLRGELKARAEKAEELLERALAREADLRPDALAMRRKRQMDRDRAAGKRGKGNG